MPSPSHHRVSHGAHLLQKAFISHAFPGHATLLPTKNKGKHYWLRAIIITELLLSPHIYTAFSPHTLIPLPAVFMSDLLVHTIHHKSTTTTNNAVTKETHHRMAFDSAGLAKRAQNRLHKASWSRTRRKYWMWSRSKKENIILTTNHREKMTQSESFRIWQNITSDCSHHFHVCKMGCMQLTIIVVTD